MIISARSYRVKVYMFRRYEILRLDRNDAKPATDVIARILQMAAQMALQSGLLSNGMTASGGAF